MSGDLDYDRVMRRVARVMAFLWLAGLGGWTAWKGLHAGLSFCGGAAVSALSFYLLYRLGKDIGKAMEGGRVKPFGALLHAFRLLILGGATYVIVRVYGAYPPALVSGLLLTVAAATIEVLIELFYARA